MVLSVQEKSNLSANILNIKNKFNMFNTTKNYMGVYFDSDNKTFLTFLQANTFSENMKLGKKTYTNACVYVCAANFDTQTSAFLA
jgi:hypothetical protein